MGQFFLGLAAVLGASAKPILFRILLALGIGIATYTGSEALLGSMQNLVIAQFGGLPDNVIRALGMANVDVFINMIFSAFAIRIAISQTVNWVKIPG